MKCVICRSGETLPGTMTVMLELSADGAVAVIRSVPADRCVNCGEGYLTEAAAERVEAIAEQLREAGIQLAVREYEAAA
jgi:YgiT-type zinc finger domain-containing protein